jgi:hypothetical protein
MRSGRVWVVRTVGTLLAALVLVTGTSTAAAFTANHSADPSPASFNDPTGDSIGGAPDMSVIVASIDGTDTITFQISTNEATLSAEHAIYVDLDTDQNAATGNPQHFGAEYVLSIVGPTNSFGAVRWQNANWQSIQLTSLSASYANGMATFTVNESDLGALTGFNFYVVSQASTGESVTAVDWAPDRGVWNYTWRTAALKLSVALFSAPRNVKAGKAFVVAMESKRSDTGEFVGIGARVRCRARLGAKTILQPRFTGFETVESESAAVCAYRAPIKARGKTIRGSITVSVGGSSVSRIFTTRVN